MPTVQVTSQIEIDFDKVLEGVARLEPHELDEFVKKVIALQAQRRIPSLSGDETALLKKINQGVSPEIRKRYEALNENLHEEIITPDEHKELLTLIDQIELADAERMQHLIALAQLRKVSIDTLMDQLGINRPTYA